MVRVFKGEWATTVTGRGYSVDSGKKRRINLLLSLLSNFSLLSFAGKYSPILVFSNQRD
jgi:hypothetical protein